MSRERWHKPQDSPTEGGLSRSIRAYYSDELPRIDVERDVLKGDYAGKAETSLIEMNDGMRRM